MNQTSEAQKLPKFVFYLMSPYLFGNGCVLVCEGVRGRDKRRKKRKKGQEKRSALAVERAFNA